MKEATTALGPSVLLEVSAAELLPVPLVPGRGRISSMSKTKVLAVQFFASQDKGR